MRVISVEARIETVLLPKVTRSIVYIRNRIGPSTELCETPQISLAYVLRATLQIGPETSQ